MYKITDFHADDLACITLQPHQLDMAPHIAAGYGRFLQDAGPAQTLWRGNKPLACFGILVKWQGLGEIWAVIDADIGSAMVRGERAAQELFDNAGHDRLQAHVDATFDQGLRLMRVLGFKVEGKLQKYMPNGNDAFLFSKVNGALLPVAKPEINIQTLVERMPGATTLMKILRLEEALAKLPQIPNEPVLYQGHKLKGRSLFMQKGACVVGKMHRFDHISTINRGDISVFTEDGVLQRFKAGDIIEGKAGIKRAVYVHDDTVWTTFHGTDKIDWAEVEQEIIVPPDEFLRLLEVAA